MDFLRKFIKRLAEIIGAKILDNPLSFLGVTGSFIITLYLIYLDNGELNFSIEDYISLGIFYIIMLCIFMNKDLTGNEKVENKTKGTNVEIKQNNISLFSFFKNVRK